MKRTFIVILMGLILAGLALLFVPRMMVHHYWNKTDQLSKTELYKSALDYTLKAKAISERWGMKPAYLKSLIYEIKCKDKLGISDEEIVYLLRDERNSHPTPVKELVTTMYLEKLWNYYVHHHRFFEQTYEAGRGDISQWNSKQFLREIIRQIDTLRKAKNLRFFSFSPYQKNICSPSDRPVHFSNVYEFVTWHSIDILQWSDFIFYMDRSFSDPSERYMVPLKDFLNTKISSRDSFDTNTTSIILYQDLLRCVSSRYKPRLTYEIEIQRLNRIRNSSSADKPDEIYLKTLQGYRKSIKDMDTRLMLDYIIMKEFEDQHRWMDFRKKCDEIVRNYPSWKPEVKECSKDLKRVSQKSLNLQAESVFDPDENVDINITANHADTIVLNLFKLNWTHRRSAYPTIDRNSYSSFTRKLLSQKLMLLHNQFLQEETRTVRLGRLKPGIYLISAGYTKNLQTFKNVVEWKIITVSGLAGFYHDNGTENEIYVVSRKSGKPIQNASASAYVTRRKELIYKADKDGCIMANDSIFPNNFLVAFRGDTVSMDAGYQNWYPSNETTEHVTIFTDRAVYRPSQKIFFKGILDKHDAKHNKYIPVVNRKFRVSLEDNGYRYNRIYVTTNEFGSFSGSFEIPPRIPLGSLEIVTEYGTSYVEVEEYKPTKLRMQLLPFDKPAAIGDSIILKGCTKYLNGLPGRNIPVDWSVSEIIHKQYRFMGRKTVSSGKVFSDAFGQFSIPFKTNPLLQDKQKNFDYEYSFSVQCSNEFGEIQYRSADISFGDESCSAVIGIKEYVTKQKKFKIPVSFSFNENSITPRTCRLDIYKLISKKTYQNLDEIQFDSLQKGDLVYSKTLSNQNKYVFDATSFQTMDQGFYIAEVTASVNGKIHVHGKQYFTFIDPKSTEPKIEVEQFLIPLSTEAHSGETVRIIAGTVLPDLYGLFTISKNNKILYRRWVHLSKSQRVFAIPVTEKMLGGFHVSFVNYSNYRYVEKSYLIKVPFDNKKLDLSLDSYRSFLYAGEEVTWKLKAKTHTGKPAKAEMVATLYDKALDEINPHSFEYAPFTSLEEQNEYESVWQNMSVPHMNGSSSATILLEELPPPPPLAYYYNRWGSFFPVINWNMDRTKKGKPALCFRRYDDHPRDNTKVESSNLNIADLSNGMVAPPPPPEHAILFVPPEALRLTQESTHNIPRQTKIRKDFRETAFFIPQAKTDENGTVTFHFTMPDALTSWKLLGLAHTKDLKTGTITKEVVTQKDFMIFPNWPRFIRSGDTITMNSRIENNTQHAISGQASLEIKDQSALYRKIFLSNAGKPFYMKGRANTLVQWKLLVPQNVQTLTFLMKATAGTMTDGEEMTLPVLPDEILKTETVPIFLNENKAQSWQILHLVRQDLKNIRNHQFALEFSADPAWNIISSLGYLTDYPYECAEQLFNKYVGFCMAEAAAKKSPVIHQVFNMPFKSNAVSPLESNPELKSCLLEETPWMFDAKNETDRLQKISALFNDKNIKTKKTEILEKLKGFQTGNGGIEWFQGLGADFYISSYLLEALGKIKHVSALKDFNEECPGFLTRLLSYCDDFFVTEYNNLKKHPGLPGYPLINYAYARSYFIRDYPLEADKKQNYQSFIQFLKTQWPKSRLYERPVIALILYRNQGSATCNQIIASLNELAVKDPYEGMYWYDKHDSYSYDQLNCQASALELYTETRQDRNIIGQMKNWLYLQRKNNHWHSTITTARICYQLLNTEGFKQPENKIYAVTVGDQSFTANTGMQVSNLSGMFRKSWNTSQVKPSMGNIKIQPITHSHQPAWGAAYWQYFQKMQKGTETSSGVWIRKMYYIKTGKGYLPVKENAKIRIGDEIKVRLDIGTDKAVSYVHVKDLRPSCLEPMSKNSGCRFDESLFYFESIRDASQNFFIEGMPAGKYVIEYDTRVTHKGFFRTGNAAIQCMYAPENIGYSGSESLRVE